MWIEVVKELLVPGGLLSIFAVWWTTSHTKKDDEKTEIKAQRKAQSEQIVEESGIEARWRALFAETREGFNQQLQEIRVELAEERAENERYRRKHEDDARIIQTLYGYSHRVRAQVINLGGEPFPWPPSIDPDRI